VKEFFANAAEIIKAASSSPLGIVALIILAVFTLAYLFFAKSTDERKTAVFFGTMAFVAFLIVGGALATKSPTVPGGTANSPSPAVAQPAIAANSPSPAAAQPSIAANSPSPPAAQPAIAPYSAIPAEYVRLHDLMAAGRWREADQENVKVMLKVAGREKEDYLGSATIQIGSSTIQNFSCSALREIDRLWVEASNGRFGFSVQKQIWKDVGGTPGVYNSDITLKFLNRVGWRQGGRWLSYSEFTFNTNAPKGHLPGVLNMDGFGLSYCLQKFADCNL